MRIGDYEVGKELHRGVETVSFLACRAGDRKKRPYILRRFVPSSATDDPTAAHAEAEAFLASLDLQRRVADGRGRHWVRVHARGWVDEQKADAYGVVDFHPRSLQKLFAGRVRLGAGPLYALLYGILSGLKELEAAAHRPHGALTPGHVLLTAQRNLRRARPLLTSPAFRKQELDQDWNALGGLIYEAVFFRPYTRSVGWPLRPSPEWQKLGPRGEAWREFCSRLLNPGIRASVDDVLRAATALRPSVGRKVARGMGAAALAAVAALAVMVWTPGTRNWPVLRDVRRVAMAAAKKVEAWRTARRMPAVPPAWRDLCLHYARWFGPLLDDLSEDRRTLWSQDAHLREVLRSIDEAVAGGVEFDPRVIAGVPAAFPDHLKDYLPEGARTPEASAAIETALASALRVGALLDAGLWPARARIRQGVADFRARAWEEAAGYLASVDEAVPCPASPKPDPAAVDAVLGLAAVLDRVEEIWAGMDNPPDREAFAARLREAPANLTALVDSTGSGAEEEQVPPVVEADIPEPAEEITEDQRRKEALAARLAAERDVSLTGSAVINDAWQDQCAGLLETAGPVDAMEAQARALKKFLEDLDWILPLDAPREDGSGAAAEESLRDGKIWDLREQALRQLLDAARAAGPVPGQSAVQFLQTDIAAGIVRDFDTRRR